ncbi:unnamed protein product [Oikopleura dioica]|uniref:Uncharacterized protein n=1 Tax=Oikopleura dioica TaxID=34765 RepID=E4XKX7_OIKDI|nr:unnamed protein product [Oikopleura dioica]
MNRYIIARRTIFSKPVSDLPSRPYEPSFVQRFAEKYSIAKKEEARDYVTILEENQAMIVGRTNMHAPTKWKINYYIGFFVLLFVRIGYRESQEPGGYLRNTILGEMGPNNRFKCARDDFLKIKGIVFELYEMAANEKLFYSMNPHMREFKNVKFYSFPEDENRMCPIERVNIPVLGSF